MRGIAQVLLTVDTKKKGRGKKLEFFYDDTTTQERYVVPAPL